MLALLEIGQKFILILSKLKLNCCFAVFFSGSANILNNVSYTFTLLLVNREPKINYSYVYNLPG